MKKKLLFITTMATLALATACGNKPSTNTVVEVTESEVKLEETTEEIKTEEITETVDTEKVTEAAETTEEETIQVDENEMLNEMFGEEQTDDVLEHMPEYIGSQQIETQYAILDLEDGVTVSEEEIARVDILFETIEKVTNLSFLNGKYGINKKITLQIYNEVGSCAADNCTKSIMIEKSCLDENFLTMAHELMHILEICYSYSGAFPFYSEGYAEYWTYKIGQYIIDNDVKELTPYVDIEFYSQVWADITRGIDYRTIYDEDIEHWMDQSCYFAFNDSWPAYVYGRFFFMYIEDTYGNVNDFLKIYCRIPYGSTGIDENAGEAGRKFMDLEPYIKMMKVTYGEDVFDGFYPWLKEHEDVFKQYNNQ